MDQKRIRYLLIALLVSGCTILSTLGGAVAGGVAGYFAGRSAARSTHPPRIEIRPGPEERFHFEIPTPEIPEPPFEWRPGGPGFEGGALIKEIVEGTSADDADLREGDLITHVDGEPITPNRDLATLVRRHKPGDRIELTVKHYETVFSSHIEIPWHQD